jgi:hypothetical protein
MVFFEPGYAGSGAGDARFEVSHGKSGLGNARFEKSWKEIKPQE